MTADLVESLLAVLDAAMAEAEAARGGGAGVWSVDGYPHYDGGRIEDDQGEVIVYDEGSPTPEQAAHIARHDPAAVLRRIAGDRRQLARHADDGHGDCTTCGEDDGSAEVNGMALSIRAGVDYPCATVRDIADGWGVATA